MKKPSPYVVFLFLAAVSSFSISFYYYGVEYEQAIFITAVNLILCFYWEAIIIQPNKIIAGAFTRGTLLAVGIWSVCLAIVLLTLPEYPESLSSYAVSWFMFLDPLVVSIAVSSLIAAGFWARAIRQREMFLKEVIQVLKDKGIEITEESFEN